MPNFWTWGTLSGGLVIVGLSARVGVRVPTALGIWIMDQLRPLIWPLELKGWAPPTQRALKAADMLLGIP